MFCPVCDGAAGLVMLVLKKSDNFVLNLGAGAGEVGGGSVSGAAGGAGLSTFSTMFLASSSNTLEALAGEVLSE